MSRSQRSPSPADVEAAGVKRVHLAHSSCPARCKGDSSFREPRTHAVPSLPRAVSLRERSTGNRRAEAEASRAVAGAGPPGRGSTIQTGLCPVPRGRPPSSTASCPAVPSSLVSSAAPGRGTEAGGKPAPQLPRALLQTQAFVATPCAGASQRDRCLATRPSPATALARRPRLV